MQYKYRKLEYRDHLSALVYYPHQKTWIEIDKGLVDFMLAMWAANFRTVFSCIDASEGYNGLKSEFQLTLWRDDFLRLATYLCPKVNNTSRKLASYYQALAMTGVIVDESRTAGEWVFLRIKRDTIPQFIELFNGIKEGK